MPTQVDESLTPEADELIQKVRATERHQARQDWYKNLLIGGLIVTIFAIIFSFPVSRVDTVTEQRNTAVTQKDNLASVANSSADTALALCLGNNTGAKQLAASGQCELAKQLKQAVLAAAPAPATGPSGSNGTNGVNGQPGRGIIATAIVDGHFKITYTDGVTEDKGQVVGSQGKTGDPGRGITGTTIGGGHLIITYTDGGTVDAGQVVGKDGSNGRGVTQFTITGAYHLVVAYSDGTSQDIGLLPSGPKGDPGVAGAVGPRGAQGNDGQPPVSWTTHNLDGTTTVCNRSASFDYQNPTYDCTQQIIAPTTTPTTPTS
jgi:hypothetical protein